MLPKERDELGGRLPIGLSGLVGLARSLQGTVPLVDEHREVDAVYHPR
jgi:hypothetical protein